MPDWYQDFQIAQKLGVPVPEVEHLPISWTERAKTVLKAEDEYNTWLEKHKPKPTLGKRRR